MTTTVKVELLRRTPHGAPGDIVEVDEEVLNSYGSEYMEKTKKPLTVKEVENPTAEAPTVNVEDNAEFKAKEAELATRESAIQTKEDELKSKEDILTQKESDLNKKDEDLKAKEAELVKREEALTKKDNKVTNTAITQ